MSHPPNFYTHQPAANRIEVELKGDWLIQQGILQYPKDTLDQVSHIIINGHQLGAWDSALIVFLRGIWDECKAKDIQLQTQNLSAEIINLINISLVVPKHSEHLTVTSRHPAFDKLVQLKEKTCRGFDSGICFLGDAIIALCRMSRGKQVFRSKDFLQYLYDAGPASLPIITLISIIIGMIMAFVGAAQLQQFGAEIFISSLVGLAMAREMAALMTGIIMAGRTGASYAARLGSMQVNEEIDALKTMGIIPFDFLVLPRLLALTIMMPLLTLYSMALGILGGSLVAIFMLDVPIQLYFSSMAESVALYHFELGLLKSIIFGALIALCGCYKGINCGRSATAVGRATTEAVVVSIVLIIVTDCIAAIITTLVGA